MFGGYNRLEIGMLEVVIEGSFIDTIDDSYFYWPATTPQKKRFVVLLIYAGTDRFQRVSGAISRFPGQTEVLAGVSEEQKVEVHTSNKLKDGVAVQAHD